MESIIMNDERLRCPECQGTEAHVVLKQYKSNLTTETICTECGTYTILPIDAFNLYEELDTD